MQDDELTLAAVRRRREPQEVTFDRVLLVGLILGPTLLVMGAMWSGLTARAETLRADLDRAGACTGFCPDPPPGSR